MPVDGAFQVTQTGSESLPIIASLNCTALLFASVRRHAASLAHFKRRSKWQRQKRQRRESTRGNHHPITTKQRSEKWYRQVTDLLRIYSIRISGRQSKTQYGHAKMMLSYVIISRRRRYFGFPKMFTS